jgi:hypothetical protein
MLQIFALTIACIVLSGKTIKGFEKVDHGHYRTENFDQAKNKIYISVDAAISSYTITRY